MGPRLPAGSWIALLIVLVAALLYYKWGGAIQTVDSVNSSQVWSRPTSEVTSGQLLGATIAYFKTVWIALAFGLVIGSVVLAVVPVRALSSMLGSHRTRSLLLASAVGAPLMLCSCCVSPLAFGVHKRGASMGSALAIMLASPGLNPAAHVLTFILFPAHLAVARLATTLIGVFGIPRLIALMTDRSIIPDQMVTAAATMEQTQRSLISRLAQSFLYLLVITVPLLLIGTAISSVFVPMLLRLSTGATFLMICLVAAVAVLVALPTFFEIPLALTLLELGAPGCAAALLIAGPIINLPSLLVLGREAGPLAASVVATAVWFLAITAGVSVQQLMM